MAYIIQKEQRQNARRLGVVIVASKDPDKKIDVFQNGIRVASIGAKGMMDFYLYRKAERAGKFPRGYANERKRLYKLRHMHNETGESLIAARASHQTGLHDFCSPSRLYK